MKKSAKSDGHVNSMLNTPKVVQRCDILREADKCRETF